MVQERGDGRKCVFTRGIGVGIVKALDFLGDLDLVALCEEGSAADILDLVLLVSSRKSEGEIRVLWSKNFFLFWSEQCGENSSARHECLDS